MQAASGASERRTNKPLPAELASRRTSLPVVVLWLSSRDAVPECDAIQKLHHDERLPILLVDFMNRANVGMVQSRSGLCFTAKAAQDLSIFGHFVGQKLQRNKAIEFGVLGFEYYAHPAGTQLLDDAIVRDGLADHGRRLSPEHSS
jgi:hypothetical protein